MIKLQFVKNGPNIRAIIWHISEGPKVVLEKGEGLIAGQYKFNSSILESRDLSPKQYQEILASKVNEI